MRYIIFILTLIVAMAFTRTDHGISLGGSSRDTVPSGVPQLFGGKYYKFNGYVLVDSFIMNAPGDTNNVPRYPSLKFKSSDNRWYGWDRTRWQRFALTGDSGISQNLQQVTDRGNKTTDTIIANGLRTSHILGDTLNEPDFEFDVFPDLQIMTQYSPDILYTMFDWVRDNKTTENIQGLFQVGDLTNNGNVAEFKIIDTAFKKIDSLNMSYLYALGNHDFDNKNACLATTVNYDAYLGPSRFAGHSFYGGNFQGNNKNYYIKFDVGKHKYIAVGLEFFPRDSAIDWASSVLDSNLDREAIIVTHAYITSFGEKSVDTSKWSESPPYCGTNRGQQLWDKLIKKHKNIFLTLSGHYIINGGVVGNEPPSIKRITQAGENGNTVYQLLVNYQSDTLGGNGYFMRMKFKPSTGKIDLSFFSPYLNRYDARVEATAYALDYPAIKIDAAVGISSVNGSLSVAGETRLDSSLSITKIPRDRLLYTDINGLIQNDSLLVYKNSKIGVGRATPLYKFDLNGNSRLTGSILLEDSITQTTTSAINSIRSKSYFGNRVVEGTNYNFFGTAALRSYNEQTFTGNPVSHVTNFGAWQYWFVNSGSTINASGAFTNILGSEVLRFAGNATVSNSSGSGLRANHFELFYTKNSLNPGAATITGPTAIANANSSLSISAGATGSTGPLTITGWLAGAVYRMHLNNTSHSLENFADQILGTSIQGSGSSVTNRYGTYILPIKQSFVTNGYSIYQAGASDTNYFAGIIRVPNTAAAIDTANFKPGVFDASGVLHKMSGWPAVAGSISSINSQTGPAITVQDGTATSVATTTNTVTVNIIPSSNAIPHTLDAQFTTQGNSGTSETDLYSYSVPADKLAIDGRTVNFEIDGEFNDATATAQLKLYFAGNVTLNTGATIISTAFTAWKLCGYIIRTSSTTAHVTYELQCPGLATPLFLGYLNLTSLDFTIGNIFKITAQAGGVGAGTSDITAHSWQVLYKPQPQ